MKVSHIKSIINENIGKSNLDEESFFEGHNFITYGKNIELITAELPQGQIDKDSVIVKWVVKFDMGNIGIFGVNIDIKSIVAEIGEDQDSNVQKTPMNLNGFEHKIIKRKNGEIQELQIFLSSIHIDTNLKKIDFEFTI